MGGGDARGQKTKMLLRSLAGWLAGALPLFFLFFLFVAVVDCVIGTRFLEPFTFPCRRHRLRLFLLKNFDDAIFL